MITIAAEDAARCATTAEQAITYERHLGVRASNALRIQDQPAMAHEVLLRSVERQARIAGCGRIHIPLPARTNGVLQ